MGRSDDVLIIGGGNIHPEVVAEAVYKVEGLSNHFQLIAEILDKKDRLRVKVEALSDSKNSYKEMAEKLKKAIYDKSKELKTMFDEGLINDIAVEIVKPNGLERNPRTGKIRLIVDERY